MIGTSIPVSRPRGVPDRPGAWLTVTAWRKALDRLRRDRVALARAPDLVRDVSYDLEAELDRSSLDDDQLRMLFACCHPALMPEVRMALTLRSVAGLTVPEIARAFLSSESAMERRLVRARRKVTDARIPFRVAPDELLAERLAGVLRVVYLVFNEGHVATGGERPVRGELCVEAIRLARLLVRLMPDAAQAHGLLALLLLTDARRAARVDLGGELVSLEEQDRARWDAARIEEGVAILERAVRLGRPGAYLIQPRSRCRATRPSARRSCAGRGRRDELRVARGSYQLRDRVPEGRGDDFRVIRHDEAGRRWVRCSSKRSASQSCSSIGHIPSSRRVNSTDRRIPDDVTRRSTCRQPGRSP